MSVTGGGDLFNRLNATAGSGEAWLSGADTPANVRSEVARLRGKSSIDGDDLVGLIDAAKDYRTITTGEREELVAFFRDRAGDMTSAAQDAMSRFLNEPVPLSARQPTPVDPSAPSRSSVLTGLGNAATASTFPAFAADSELSSVLAGQLVLRNGDRGDGAKTVQRALLELGFDLGAGGADGHFGNATKTAIQGVQRRAGLPRTGEVDKATLTAISTLLAESKRASFSTTPGLAGVARGQSQLRSGARGEAAREVQLALLDAGFSVGRAGADGHFGAGTANALKALQRTIGLPATGVVDQRTLEALGRMAGPDHRADRTAPLIGGSVGVSGANKLADVAAVQTRLKALGFYSGSVNGQYSGALSRSIQLFDAVCNNADHLARYGSARRNERTLTPGEGAERWMRADNAPGWQKLPRSGGTGWVNADRDGHSYAASWALETLNRVGTRYEASRATHAGWTKIHTNDASRAHGGDTHDHDTHEAGLDLDINLGRGNLTYRSAGYNREETWAKVKAFLDDPSVEQVLFNDPVLIQRANADTAYAGRLKSAPDHHHHLHIDLKVPTRRTP